MVKPRFQQGTVQHVATLHQRHLLCRNCADPPSELPQQPRLGHRARVVVKDGHVDCILQLGQPLGRLRQLVDIGVGEMRVDRPGVDGVSAEQETRVFVQEADTVRTVPGREDDSELATAEVDAVAVHQRPGVVVVGSPSRRDRIPQAAAGGHSQE